MKNYAGIRKSRTVSAFVDKYIGHMFLVPAALIVILLLIYPIFSSLFYGLTDRTLLSPVYEFIGLTNYKSVLTDPNFWNAFKNSIIWTAASVILQLLLGLAAALLLHRAKKFKGFFRTVLIIPWAFPNIVIAFTWSWMFNDMYGAINSILLKFGFISQPILFLSDARISMLSMIIINTWFGFPFMMVSLLAALQSIPIDEYEAAKIDGASGWQSFKHITLPHLSIVIGLLVVLRTIWVFNNFDLIFLVTGGGPGTSTETLPLYAYRTGWILNSLGKASAVATILLVFLLIISFLYFRILNRLERGEVE